MKNRHIPWVLVSAPLAGWRALGVLLIGWAATPWAQAHVKWFSRDADCAMPPLTPLQVVADVDFLALGALTLLVMVEVGLVDRFLSRPGALALRGAETLDHHAKSWVAPLLRLSLAAFFCLAVLYFGDAPVLLTPELKSSSSWVTTVQIGIALCLLTRRTAWWGALGIAVLYAAAVGRYGWFHLLDYPVFLGAAAFVAIDSLSQGRRLDLGLQILRVSAGVTLMWAGAEKWLYPWWSYPIVEHELSAISMGMTPHAFMVAAGWVEFAAAFALVFGRLVVQLAAWVLLLPFLAAIPVFGTLDAVGHAPIIVVLLILGITRNRLPLVVQGSSHRVASLSLALSCLMAALCSVGLYWGLQWLAYRPVASVPVEMALIAVLLVLPLLCWLMPRPLPTRLQKT